MSAAVETRLALAILHRRRQLQIVEQHIAQLLRRADVEGPPGQACISAVRRAISRFHQPREALQLVAVNEHAGAFHARQHARQGQFDGGVELPQPARVHRRRQQAEKLQRDIGVLLRRGAELQVQTPPRLLFERDAPGSASSRKAYSMMSCSKPRASMPRRSSSSSADLHVAGDLGRARVFQPRLQVRQVLGGQGARFARRARQANGVQRKLALAPICEIATAKGAPSGTAASQARSSPGPARTRVIAQRASSPRPQFLQQAVKLQLLVDRLQQPLESAARFHRFQGEIHRHVGGDGGQPLAHADLFGVVLEALAIGLALHFARRAPWPLPRSRSARSDPCAPLSPMPARPVCCRWRRP